MKRYFKTSLLAFTVLSFLGNAMSAALCQPNTEQAVGGNQVTVSDAEVTKLRQALLSAERATFQDKKLIAKCCYELAKVLPYLPNTKKTPCEKVALLKRAMSLSEKNSSEYLEYARAVDACTSAPAKSSTSDAERYKLSDCLDDLDHKQMNIGEWQSLGKVAVQHWINVDDPHACFFPRVWLITDRDSVPGYSAAVENILLFALHETSRLPLHFAYKRVYVDYLLFGFYASKGLEKAALTRLDGALDCDLTKGVDVHETIMTSRQLGTSCRAPDLVPFDGATMSGLIQQTCFRIAEKNSKLANAALYRLLAAQLKVLPADNIQVHETRCSIFALRDKAS